MKAIHNDRRLEVGFNIPAEVGMELEDIATPALMIDLDAFEKNVEVMANFIKDNGIRHRAHAKTHKSADIALYQIVHGGACGICCQKVSEAEALVAAGITDVLVSNQVVSRRQIDRLANMARQARVIVCVDDLSNVGDLSAAAVKNGVELECLVEIDVGAGRCGVEPGRPAVDMAQRIAASKGLSFSGLQAYNGSAQHIEEFGERRAKSETAVNLAAETLEMLTREGLECGIVAGAGTGTYYFEGTSKVYNEIQCGSYVFMDVDYQKIRDAEGKPVSEFANSLFVCTSVMSHTRPDVAVCDAGLKALSVDSGLPRVHGRDDLEYIKCSDEHGVITDPGGMLQINDKLKLIPGHCDPTCNLYDWYVGIRNNKVECLWPVTARGMCL
jgi:3-hydroxy-D-aspartate aldolase